jgi:hypothetical protein
MSRTVDPLENTAAEQRARLAATVSSLTETLDPERISQETMRHASDLTHSMIEKTIQNAKSNPAGVALVGLGLAVIAMRSPDRQPTGPDQAMIGQDARIAVADERIRKKVAIRADMPAAGPRPSASGMRKLLDAGLDRLGPEARARVTKARLKAVDAQDAIERKAARVRDAVRDQHDAQPLITTLAVAGVGALIGSLLPSTRAEVELMAAKRDQLMRDAEAILHAELERLENHGEDALKATVSAVKDAAQTDRTH